jgi:hypothetical protein
MYARFADFGELPETNASLVAIGYYSTRPSLVPAEEGRSFETSL